MPVVNLNPWSYAYIRQLAQEATEIAKRDNLRPALANEVTKTYRSNRRFNIPFLGDYVPQGWERIDWLIEPMFVDTTGKAIPGDPAITHHEFLKRVAQHIKSKEGFVIGYGVIEQGQTQVLIATYRRKEEHGKDQT
jgi:hypothetical protein